MFEFIKEKNIEKNVEATLTITPMAPLSITSEKGKYSSVNIKLRKNMILGLIENCLGIHFPLKFREKIVKGLKLKVETNTAYLPLISHLIEIVDIKTPEKYTIFSDAYSYLNKRDDKSHINGAKNVDIHLYYTEIDEDMLSPNAKKDGSESAKEKKQYIKEVLKYIPNLYTSLYKREWILTEEDYIIKIKTSIEIKDLLILAVDKNKTYYLGNSESIINLDVC